MRVKEKRRERGRRRWEITSSRSRCWHTFLQILCKFTSPPRLHVSHVQRGHVSSCSLSLSLYPIPLSPTLNQPSTFSLTLSVPRGSRLLLYSRWAPYMAASCLSWLASSIHTHAHYCKLWSHTWDDNLSHGNATQLRLKADVLTVLVQYDKKAYRRRCAASA